MAISKVVYNNNTLIDITDTTATASDVVAGQVFYQADGTRSVGTLNILDTFYPVGSIYETVDTSFDPNIAWGGTWVQIQDKFLLAAGSTYHVGDADGGSANAIVPEHNHSVNITSGSESAHTHGKGSYAGSSHTHGKGTLSGSTPTLTASNATYVTVASAMSSYNVQLGSLPTGGNYNYIRAAHSGFGIDRSAPTIPSGKTVSITGSTEGAGVTITGTSAAGSSHSHSVTGNTENQGSSATGANMPPYTIVNIWKRTA